MILPLTDPQADVVFDALTDHLKTLTSKIRRETDQHERVALNSQIAMTKHILRRLNGFEE